MTSKTIYSAKLTMLSPVVSKTTIFANGAPLFDVKGHTEHGAAQLDPGERHSAAVQLCAAANRAVTLDDSQRSVLAEIARYLHHNNGIHPSTGVRSSGVRILNSLIDAGDPIPSGIYWDGSTFRRDNGDYLGAEFNTQWTARAAEFPHRQASPLPLNRARIITVINAFCELGGIPLNHSQRENIVVVTQGFGGAVPAIPLAERIYRVGGLNLREAASLADELLKPAEPPVARIGGGYDEKGLWFPNPDGSRNYDYVPIPEGVYYAKDSDNFYGALDRIGQGNEFRDKWIARKNEFPTNVSDAQPPRFVYDPEASSTTKPANLAGTRFTERGKDMGVVLGFNPDGQIVTAKPERDRCGNCRFNSSGTCRRFPPQFAITGVTVGEVSKQASRPFWPTVADTDWCGEHECE